MKLAPRMIAGPAVALLAAGMLAGCGDPAEPEDSMSPSTSEDMMMEDDEMMEEDSMEDDAMEEDSMEEDSMDHDDDEMMEESADS